MAVVDVNPAGTEAGKAPAWEIGQRVVDDDGFRGTVRYVGPVATAKDQEAIYIGESVPAWGTAGVLPTLRTRCRGRVG
jgi:hypothetical protein